MNNRHSDNRLSGWDRFLDFGTHLPQPIEAIASFAKNFGFKCLVGIVVGFGLALGLAWLGWWIPGETNEVNRVWRLENENVFFVYSAKSAVSALRANKVFVPEEGKEQAILLTGVVNATILVNSAISSKVLQRIEPRAGVLLAEDFARGDVVSLGGPIANAAFTLAIDKLTKAGEPPPFCFDDQTMKCVAGDSAACDSDRAIHDTRPGGTVYMTQYEKQPSKAKRVVVDYGFFVIGRNPFKTESKLILIAGSHKTGTWGATRFLTDPTNAELLNGLYRQAEKNGKYFTGVVRTDSKTASTSLEVYALF